MPLPDNAVAITGGCSCGAIRYRIAVPPLSSRPIDPMSTPKNPTTLPQVAMCHCNDCRRSTSSLFAVSITDVPAPMLSVSALSPSPSEPTINSGRFVDTLADNYDASAADATRPPYVPAIDVLRATGKTNTWLRFYRVSDCGPDWSRSFCGRCGSQICYHFRIRPEFFAEGQMPDGWEDSFHIITGSIDREFVDRGWIVPEREFFFRYGTSFSQRVSATATALKHLEKRQVCSEDEVPSEKELEELRN